MTYYEEYKNRKKETEYFLKIINMYERNLFNDNFTNPYTIENLTFADYLKIIKSSLVLMLYNLMESSISLFLQYTSEEFNRENLTYQDTCEEIRNLYLEKLTQNCFNKTASYQTYEKAIKKISQEIVENIVLQLDKKVFDISGNIDGEYINEISNRLGLNFTSSSKGMHKTSDLYIGQIKNDRNKLAHGEESFLVKGQNYTSNDLKKYFDEICIIFDELWICFDNYVRTKRYKKSI